MDCASLRSSAPFAEEETKDWANSSLDSRFAEERS